MAAKLAAPTMTRAERIMAAAIIIRDAAEELAYSQLVSAVSAAENKKPGVAAPGQNKD